MSQTQCHLEDVERMLADKSEKLNNERSIRRQENEEWEQVNKQKFELKHGFRYAIVLVSTRPSYFCARCE